MTSTTRTFRLFGTMALSALVLLWSAAPAEAGSRDRRPRARGGVSRDRGRGVTRSRSVVRGGRSYGRRDGHYSGHGRDSRFRIGLNFGGGYTSHRLWVPGRYVTCVESVLVEPAHYEWRTQQVEVEPAHYETHGSEPITETLYDSKGNAHTVVVRAGGAGRVWVPARYETRRVKVHVPDRYETRTVRTWQSGYWTGASTYSHRGSGLNLRGWLKF